MESEKMFEKAVRGKMRFPYKGVVSAEDLFDLSLENLDSVFKVLNSQLKQVKEESLLTTKSSQDEELETKIEIVKYVVKLKQSEATARLQAKEKREQKQKIMEILSNKQDAALLNKTPEELQKMLDELSE